MMIMMMDTNFVQAREVQLGSPTDMNLDVSWVVKPIWFENMIRKVDQIDCGDDVDEKQANKQFCPDLEADKIPYDCGDNADDSDKRDEGGDQ